MSKLLAILFCASAAASAINASTSPASEPPAEPKKSFSDAVAADPFTYAGARARV